MKLTVSIVMLLLLVGCAAAPLQQNAEALVPLNEITRPMLGHWMSEGNTVLHLVQEDEQVRIFCQKNDTWCIDISNARIVGDEVHYITKSYVRDGSGHPFNGVAVNTIIRTRDDDRLEKGVSSEHRPDYKFYTLTRNKGK
jgi:hypothetical protein